MTLAFSLCIIFGFLIGAFQLLRMNVVDIMWEMITPFTPEHHSPLFGADKLSAWLLILFSIPILLGVFHTHPWVFMSQFFLPEDSSIVMGFSFTKFLIAGLSIGAGELVAHLFKFRDMLEPELESDEAQYHRARRNADSFANSKFDWDDWRQEHAARSAHNGTPPPEGRSHQKTHKAGHNTGHQQTRSPQQDALRTLKLSANASQADIRKAFIKMAKAHHPDSVLTPKSSDKDRQRAEGKMKKINAAYECLKANG